jgi:APA family basic amino acid/polyamine antiporter
MEAQPTPPATDFPVAAFVVSLVWISFSYSGWNAAVYLAGEVRDPDRNLPRALILGTALVTLVYLALNAVFVFAAPVDQLAGQVEVARLAASALGGAVLANLVTALIALALATSVSAMLMAGPRVYARMATDGYLPAWLRFPEAGPPRAAILLQLIVALALLWSATFKGLLTYIGFTLGLCAAGAVAGLVRLRCREGAALRVPGWPWVPLMFIATVLGMTGFTIARQPVESAIGLGTLLVGLVAWQIAVGRSGRSDVNSRP